MFRAFAAFLAAALWLGLIPPAHATTYQYTGQNYTIVGGSYTSLMSVNGYFVTDQPLAPNLVNAQIGPMGMDLVTDWSFNDGINSYTTSSSQTLFMDPTFDFVVSTDAEGNITTYFLGLMSPVEPHSVGTFMNVFIISDGGTQAMSGLPCLALSGSVCISIPGAGPVTEAPPGLWRRVEVSVPVFPPFALLALMACFAWAGGLALKRPKLKINGSEPFML